MRHYYIFAICLFSLVGDCFGQANINIERLKNQAQSGNVAAQMDLARYYETVDIDSLTNSLYWYEKAAINNNVEAMVVCGEMYCRELLKGGYWPLEIDFIKGINWYRKAAKMGSQEAKDRIAIYTSKPEQVSRECPTYYGMPFEDDLYYEDADESQTYNCIKQSKQLIITEYEKKNPLAAYYLAVLSFDQDEYSALKYLKEADAFLANSNYSFNVSFGCSNPFSYVSIEESLPPKIYSFLGYCYEFGVGCDIDYMRAANYYNSADYSSFPNEPFLRAAFCYRKAGDYERFIQEANKDFFVGQSLSKNYYRKMPCLQLELAELYKTGEGLEKNPAKALELYENIVDTRESYIGDVGASFLLPDLVNSINTARAAYRASQMYKNGEGCKPDKDMADLYFDIALKFGDRNAWYEKQKEYEKR